MKAIAAGIVAAVLLVVVVIYWSEYGPPTQTQGVPAQDAPPTATTPPLVVTPTPTTRPARATPTRPARPTLTAFRERASATPPPTATPRPTPRPTPTPFLTPQRAPTPTPFRAPQPTIIPLPTPIQPGFTPFPRGDADRADPHSGRANLNASAANAYGIPRPLRCPRPRVRPGLRANRQSDCMESHAISGCVQCGHPDQDTYRRPAMATCAARCVGRGVLRRRDPLPCQRPHRIHYSSASGKRRLGMDGYPRRIRSRHVQACW